MSVEESNISQSKFETSKSDEGKNATQADRWITRRWELWAFYVYYIVTGTIFPCFILR